jgi:uncharacterized protein (TIGR03435 family)
MIFRGGIALLAMGVFSVFAQTAGFEVASIKVVPQRAGTFSFENANAITVPGIAGNRVTISGSLSSLIRSAYNVKGNQVLNAPDWATPSRGSIYSITAKTEGDGAASTEAVRGMLQALLGERFQLMMHREMKDLPVYELAVARGGAKIKESADDARPVARITAGPVIRMAAVSKSMEDLAQMLTLQMDRPVVDKTGMKGYYDFTVEAENSALDPFRVTVLSAIREQLGLSLNAVNEATDVWVIDRAERPSEN